jgi:hypothetical protein
MEAKTPEEEKVINKKPKSEYGLKSITSNPYIFIGLAVISLLSFAFGIYSWLDNKASRELTYFVNPARAVVVQSGKTSDLSVSYKGELVQGDITAVQIAIWNAGKLPVKSGDILKPIVFYTETGAQILEATIRNPGREVCQVSLDHIKLKEGRVTVNWGILEINDATVVQVIYAGDSNVAIKSEGIIEGQGSLIQSGESAIAKYMMFAFAFILGGAVTLGILELLFEPVFFESRKQMAIFIVPILLFIIFVMYFLVNSILKTPFVFE